MPNQDYNIVVRVETVGRRETEPRMGGRVGKSWAKGFDNIELKRNLNNTRRTMGYHILSQSADKLLSNVGTVTGDELTQNRINLTKRVGSHLVMTALNPVVGGVGIGMDVVGEGIAFWTEQRNKRLEAQALKLISGNSTNTGNRYSGKKI